MDTQPCQRPRLILAHQAAVAGDIGSKDGREPALNPLSAQHFLPGR
jgi:hypothetical protein